ncbi:MAG: hypothetical protein FJ118_05790 [Deltaproteobacteria bacterium]|nr:hypothetical protein [Deltaproteobacteria bacterium]
MSVDNGDTLNSLHFWSDFGEPLARNPAIVLWGLILESTTSAVFAMTDEEFREVLDQFGLSWRGYRKVRKGVKQRLARNMLELECRTVRAYLDKAASNQNLKRKVEALLTVTISRFMRDRRLWECLDREIFPEAVRSGPDPIKIWCAGCA